MVRLYSQKPDEFAIPKSSCPSGLRDAKRIDDINALGRADAGDLFPLQTGITINLLPAQLEQFF